MDTDRVVGLLEEIRDLQREHLDRYEEAVENQRRSMEAQRQAIQFQRDTTRRLMWFVVPLAGLIVALIVWLLVFV